MFFLVALLILVLHTSNYSIGELPTALTPKLLICLAIIVAYAVGANQNTLCRVLDCGCKALALTKGYIALQINILTPRFKLAVLNTKTMYMLFRHVLNLLVACSPALIRTEPVFFWYSSMLPMWYGKALPFLYNNTRLFWYGHLLPFWYSYVLHTHNTYLIPLRDTLARFLSVHCGNKCTLADSPILKACGLSTHVLLQQVFPIWRNTLLPMWSGEALPTLRDYFLPLLQKSLTNL